jgi:hypothetical protein
MYRYIFRKIIKNKYIRKEKPINIKLNKLYKEIDEEYNFYRKYT